MSIHSGTLSVIEIQKIYNVGFSYAKNIVDKLEEIGYIKKRTPTDYLMIQTEQAINTYIKEHFAEFRPSYYDALELKNNGKPTLKAKAKTAWKSAPMFLCRVFISPFSVILALIVSSSKSSIGEIIYAFFIVLFILGGIFNTLYGIFMSNRKGIKFTEFMLRPWFHIRVQTVSEIHGIMKRSNIKFKVSDYYETLDRLKSHLTVKKKLAEHYADIANNAENENEFYQSINSCLEVLEWMSQFEKYGVYKIFEKPSDDIKKIKDGMDISIERFRKRMEKSGQITYSDYDIMDGHQFEYFCADILRKNGFSNVTVTQGSGDHGIDILADKYGVSYAIQCKRYDKSVNNSAVQQAIAGKGIYKKDIAVVLTNQYFTPQAIEEAAALGVKLWDRNKLNEMIENQREGMP